MDKEIANREWVWQQNLKDIKSIYHQQKVDQLIDSLGYQMVNQMSSPVRIPPPVRSTALHLGHFLASVLFQGHENNANSWISLSLTYFVFLCAELCLTAKCRLWPKCTFSVLNTNFYQKEILRTLWRWELVINFVTTL